MTTTRPIKSRYIVAAVLLAFAASAGAQKAQKKLYCWNQNGHRTCGDTLPPGATDLARTEINPKSGMHIDEIDRALTPEERAAAAVAKKQADANARAKSADTRRDLAMVESYNTEADLHHAYNERIILLDLAIKASMLGETNMRNSLVSQLNIASNIELSGKPVPKSTLATIRTQHVELLRQQRILVRQRSDRKALDGELDDAMERYRAMKHPEDANNADADKAPEPPAKAAAGATGE